MNSLHKVGVANHKTVRFLPIFAVLCLGLAVGACASARDMDEPGGSGPGHPYTPPVQPPPDPAKPDKPDEPDDPGCTDTQVQLLENPDFELGRDNGWIEQANDPLVVARSGMPVVPHDGDYGLWLGGVRLASQIVHQDIAIPEDARGIQLSGYFWIQTNEKNTLDYDTVRIELRDSAGSNLQTIALWGNTDEASDWAQFNFPLSDTYVGQTVRLHIEGQTDLLDNTNFYFDTLSLQITLCQ